MASKQVENTKNDSRKVILFQGDSITDCGRMSDKEGLGQGYVRRIVDLIAEKYPDKEYSFINKGISGNRTNDLVDRWQADCLDLSPNVTVLMIGINDVWRKVDSAVKQSSLNFTKNLRFLFESLKAIKSKIIVIEPFLLPCGKACDSFRRELNSKIDLLRAEALKYADAYIPMDGIFYAQMIKNKRTAEYFAQDGVHPSPEGADLIAQKVAKVISKFL